MAALTELDERLCDEAPADYSDLRAVYINCTLKRSPEVSHTQGLADRSIAIMERNGVWLGEKSSVCTQVIERLYGNSRILGSTRTTAASAAASSPATRMARSIAP